MVLMRCTVYLQQHIPINFRGENNWVLLPDSNDPLLILRWVGLQCLYGPIALSGRPSDVILPRSLQTYVVSGWLLITDYTHNPERFRCFQKIR